MASEGTERAQVSDDSVESWDMKKYASSAFRQQRLPAWSPILSPTSVLPIFLVTGALLIPAGVGLLFLSESVKEYRITYTFCPQYFPENKTFGQKSCDRVIAETNETCYCAYNFSLPLTVKSPAFVFYQLTNYHQNHRRYVNSRDDYQLRGTVQQKVSARCAPFDYAEDGRPIGVCARSAVWGRRGLAVQRLFAPGAALAAAPPRVGRGPAAAGSGRPRAAAQPDAADGRAPAAHRHRLAQRQEVPLRQPAGKPQPGPRRLRQAAQLAPPRVRAGPRGRGQQRLRERGPDSVDADRGAAHLPQAVPPRGPLQGALPAGPAQGQLRALRRLQLPGGAVPGRQDVHRDVDDGDRRGQPVPGRVLPERGLGLPAAGGHLLRAAPALPPGGSLHGQRRARHALPVTGACALQLSVGHPAPLKILSVSSARDNILTNPDLNCHCRPIHILHGISLHCVFSTVLRFRMHCNIN